MTTKNTPSANTDAHTTSDPTLDRASLNPSGPNEANVDTDFTNVTPVSAPDIKYILLAKNLTTHTPWGDMPLVDVLKKVITHVLPYCDRYKVDDVGISTLFADTYKDQARYVVERRGWYYYNGVHWEYNNEAIARLCKDFSRAVSQYVEANSTIINEADQKKIKKLVNIKSRENIIRDAQSVYPLHVSDFDKNTNLFNVLNGTLDLETGLLRPHMPEDLITKAANVVYDPSATCDRWIQHMIEVTEGDAKLAEYFQKACGLALDGHNKYECFYILYGPKTRNGKSTTMETIIALMGDYAKSANPNTIAQKRFPTSGGPSEDIARLAGVRLVNFAEPDRAMTLSASVVSTPTGKCHFSPKQNAVFRRLACGEYAALITRYLPA